MKLVPTGSQTVGPFFHIGLTRMLIPEVAPAGLQGQRFTIHGRVLDADQKPVPDALIETWQANLHGKYAHPDDVQDKPLQKGFLGFGRIATDDGGGFSLSTIKPGRVPGPGGVLQAPHIEVALFMRGLLKPLITRMYFPGDPANAEDHVLGLVEPERRATLVARGMAGRDGALEWNVICSGENETVFFDL